MARRPVQQNKAVSTWGGQKTSTTEQGRQYQGWPEDQYNRTRRSVPGVARRPVQQNKAVSTRGGQKTSTTEQGGQYQGWPEDQYNRTRPSVPRVAEQGGQYQGWPEDQYNGTRWSVPEVARGPGPSVVVAVPVACAVEGTLLPNAKPVCAVVVVAAVPPAETEDLAVTTQVTTGSDNTSHKRQ